MLLNCGAGEDKSPLDCKETQPVHPKGNQSWIFIGRTDGWTWSSNPLVTWCKEVTHLKRSWCWKRLKVGGEEDDRGWDGWMASLTQWTWVWVSSGSWWWRRRPGIRTAVCGVAKSQTQLRTELIWADTISEVHVSTAQKMQYIYSYNKLYLKYISL